jgi:hypothetical protein
MVKKLIKLRKIAYEKIYLGVNKNKSLINGLTLA